jgi:prevent-host-death family protein
MVSRICVDASGLTLPRVLLAQRPNGESHRVADRRVELGRKALELAYIARRGRGARAHRSTSCYDAGMSRVVTQRELRNDSGEIMRRLDAGESFVVTRNGVPVGELTPLRRLRFVTAESIAQIFQGAPPIDAEQFRRDLDAVAEQGIEPRG